MKKRYFFFAKSHQNQTNEFVITELSMDVTGPASCRLNPSSRNLLLGFGEPQLLTENSIGWNPPVRGTITVMGFLNFFFY